MIYLSVALVFIAAMAAYCYLQYLDFQRARLVSDAHLQRLDALEAQVTDLAPRITAAVDASVNTRQQAAQATARLEAIEQKLSSALLARNGRI